MTNEEWDKFFSLLAEFGEMGSEGREQFLERYSFLDKKQNIYVAEAVAQLTVIDTEIN